MTNSFRTPIVSILGHVDHGKTSILNSFISQNEHITEKNDITQTVRVKHLDQDKWGRFSEPLLFVDTPGHRAFELSRKNGGSLADIALLVVDINKGFAEQTHEVVSSLCESKTPFIIALNKVDTLPEWESVESNSAENCYNKQSKRAKKRIDESYYSVINTLSDYNINSDYYWNISDFTQTVPIFLTSAKTDFGLSDILYTISSLSDEYLGSQRKTSSDADPEGRVVNVGHLDGIGKYMDVLLTDGSITLDDSLFISTKNGVKKTSINQIINRAYSSSEQEIELCSAASHIRIIYSGNDRAISGSPIGGTKSQVKDWLPKMSEQRSNGVMVKSGSVSALDAVLFEFKSNDVDVSISSVGKVNKTDIRRVQSLDSEDQIIVAFQTEISKKAIELASQEDIKIITSDIIYRLVELVTEARDEMDDQIEKVFVPAEAIVTDIFAQDSDTAVIGLKIQSGFLNRADTLIRFSNNDEKFVGNITSIRKNDNSVQQANKGDLVFVKLKKKSSGRINTDHNLYKRISADDAKQVHVSELDESEKETFNKYKDIKTKRNPFWG